jgi:hypothetical protein
VDVLCALAKGALARRSHIRVRARMEKLAKFALRPPDPMLGRDV